MKSYLQVWKRGLDFAGRSRRREYWMFLLFHIIIMAVLVLIAGDMDNPEEPSVGILANLYMLATLIPAIALTIRRLHDTGRAGWWILLGFIPLIGGLIVLVFMVLDGQAESNKYGPSPK